MPKHITKGNVTYIHTATPRHLSNGAPDVTASFLSGIPSQRATLEQLDAPEIGEPIPNTPSIHAYGTTPLYFDGEPIPYTASVEHQLFFATDPDAAPQNIAFSELDDFDIWGMPEKGSPMRKHRVSWAFIAASLCIILMLVMLGIGALGIVRTLAFQDFLNHPLPSILPSSK